MLESSIYNKTNLESNFQTLLQILLACHAHAALRTSTVALWVWGHSKGRNNLQLSATQELNFPDEAVDPWCDAEEHVRFCAVGHKCPEAPAYNDAMRFCKAKHKKDGAGERCGRYICL